MLRRENYTLIVPWYIFDVDILVEFLFDLVLYKVINCQMLPWEI